MAIVSEYEYIKTVDDLIFNLQGTCDSIDSLVDFSELSDEEISKIDDSIFDCSRCGWWYDNGEEASHDVCGERICENCWEEQQED